MPIERPDWGRPAEGAYFGGRETGNAIVPAATEHAEPAAESSAQIADAEDDDSARRHRKLIADGIMTVEEVQRHYGLTAEEVEALSKRNAQSRQSIEQELAAIKKRMRDDRAAYFKDSQAQARHLDLLRQLEGLEAEPTAVEKNPDAQSDASALDPALLAEWEKQGGVDYHLKTAQRTASAALDALEGDDRQQLEEGFDSLPPAARTAITRFLAVEPGGFVRPANETSLETFASTPEGAELVKEWGRSAPRNIGIVRSRMDLMLRSMAEADRTKAEAWFNALPAQQAKAVMKALAGAR